jgi:hypothetical protein
MWVGRSCRDVDRGIPRLNSSELEFSENTSEKAGKREAPTMPPGDGDTTPTPNTSAKEIRK